MSQTVGLEQIRSAQRTLAGVAVRTPLLSAPWLQQRTDALEVRLKCENLQRAGAFKLRGAYTMIAGMDPAERARGVITYSSGNHGQGLALAAGLFGIPAVVVMPTSAPAIKVEGARRLGAEVVFEGTTTVERRARAESIAADRGLAMVPPFDHPAIIAGQASVGMEILEDWAEVEIVLVPVGGGGLLAGIAAALRQQRDDIRIIGVEPRVSDAMRRSLEAGEPVTIPAATSLADGLLPVRPGDLTFQHAQRFVDQVVTVTEEAIAEAARLLLREGKLVVEFSGAATTAALLSGSFPAAGRRIAAVLSGGNIAPERLRELV